MDPKDQEKTAFKTGLLVSEDVCWLMPCASHFLAFNANVGVQVHEWLVIYLDEIIIYTPELDSHLQHLEQAFEK